MSTKIPLTPAGVEPANFRFVAQHLNHCATAVPMVYNSTVSNIVILCLSVNIAEFSYYKQFSIGIIIPGLMFWAYTTLYL